MDQIKRKPDFEGTWSYEEDNIFLNTIGYGQFAFFIEKREAIDKACLESIRGIILDWYGESTFEGEFNEDVVRFTKSYVFDTIERGAAPNGVFYQGKKVSRDRYEGLYTVINGTTNGVRGDWSRKFMMKRFVDQSLN